MKTETVSVILKRFESPDEVRLLQKGRFELVHLGGMTIGRATYEPGWKWSEHVGPAMGARRCEVEHVGLVLSGIATAALDDGRVFKLHAGELFYIPPVPHDSWVIGDNLTFRSISLGPTPMLNRPAKRQAVFLQCVRWGERSSHSGAHFQSVPLISSLFATPSKSDR